MTRPNASPNQRAQFGQLEFSFGDSKIVCGVDEAGRGPLAGPVFASAVVLDDGYLIKGLADSKRLSALERARLAEQIQLHARAWAVAQADLGEIESLNILHASLLAMRRAVEMLSKHHGVIPDLALIDGNQRPSGLKCMVQTIVGGDARVPAISAASILAKTARDAEMTKLAQEWPGYGFEKHMGYGTPAHLSALRTLGPCPIHRRGFAPIRALLEARKALS
jgi:ribonuclease HII